MRALLIASSVGVGRGDRTLLGNVSFRVEPGDVLHLRGRNGAGKSSLIEVLVGLRPALSGQVQRPEPAQLHWVGHRNALNADLGITDNLLAWCALAQVSPALIPAALERMGLSKLRLRPTRTLSAGQKRRAALARLLLVRRPLWLLDEPLSGLDHEGQRLLGELMNEHVAGEGGIVVTSHQALPGRLPRVTTLELA